ncbi:hypothetical protein [uncultured Chitinophaga sp.]|mgnify:CR=1 FL=1|jgi:hypothetical protein|uniref:hypothetical protein n=1 Tax=uncultured Chitinophaga sp. TaxID=339340 RepID=UPI00262BCAAB|nr:hypothetical protein [uncultured Chitinophaga sp.]
MEPITTTALTAFLISLATKGLEKATETSAGKISEGAISWIKSLFFKDDKPKKALENLIETPNDPERQKIVNSIVENAVQDDPRHEAFLSEILAKIPKTGSTITNSKNVNTGDVSTGGGDFRIGDDYGK